MTSHLICISKIYDITNKYLKMSIHAETTNELPAAELVSDENEGR